MNPKDVTPTGNGHSDGLTKMRRLDDARMVEARNALLAIGMTPYMVGGALAAAIECATSDWWADATRMAP